MGKVTAAHRLEATIVNKFHDYIITLYIFVDRYEMEEGKMWPKRIHYAHMLFQTHTISIWDDECSLAQRSPIDNISNWMCALCMNFYATSKHIHKVMMNAYKIV